MNPLDLSGKNAMVFGVANDHSIAWSIADTLHNAGANVGLSYAGETLKKRVEPLVSGWDSPFLVECDVGSDASIESAFEQIKGNYGTLDIMVHSIAFADREDLGSKPFIETSRQGFHTAMGISAYSMIALARESAPLMENGGAMLTLTYQASERVFPGYNIMGTAKAALENIIRQLAYDLGPQNIRVNAISAGPVQTLSARGVKGFNDFRRVHVETSPMERNIDVEEVGKAALYLLSPMASGVTGEIHYVDTGYNIMGMRRPPKE